MRKFLSIIALSVLCFATATTLKVPQDHSTIQGALNSASSGDTVLVSAGTYNEKIVWPQKSNITLLGEDGAENTIIDADRVGGKVLVMSGGYNSPIVDPKLIGLTIKGGLLQGSRSNGAGVYCVRVNNLLIDDCIITDNMIDDTTGGTWCYGAGMHLSDCGSVVIQNSELSENINLKGSWGYGGAIYFTDCYGFNIFNCDFKNNVIRDGSRAYGGAIYVDGGSGDIDSSRFTGNITAASSYSYGTVLYLNEANVNINKTRIENNGSKVPSTWCEGSAIYATGSFNASNLSLTNCLIRENHLEGGSFGKKSVISINEYSLDMMNTTVYNDYNGFTHDHFAVVSDNFFTSTTTNIVNSILWASKNSVEFENGDDNTLSVSFSAVQGGYSGAANISDDPLFADTLCHLSSNSPCLGAGTMTNAPSTDIDGNARPYPVGTNVDMGCYEYPVIITSTQDLFDGELSVYPNPVSFGSDITLLSDASVNSFTIVDSYGRIVLSGNTVGQNEIVVETSQLNAGIYFVTIDLENGESVVKQIVVAD